MNRIEDNEFKVNKCFDLIYSSFSICLSVCFAPIWLCLFENLYFLIFSCWKEYNLSLNTSIHNFADLLVELLKAEGETKIYKKQTLSSFNDSFDNYSFS